MIPVYEDLLLYDEETEEVPMPSLTFRMDEERNTISGMVDDLDGLKQSIKTRLQIEMEEYEIFSPGYGVDLADKIGQPVYFLLPDIEMMLEDAILEDERVVEVADIDAVLSEKHGVTVTFTVVTEIGDANMELEVGI